MSRSNNPLVYSSDKGRICPDCGKAQAECACRKTQVATKHDGIVRLHRESKGRKGKGVTLISGVPLTGDELKNLAKTLKQKCGSGGTIKNGIIEIQGDHRDLLFTELQKNGWTVKKAGG
ncbi:MAG: translation initiation factor SUI1 [Desulfuromonadales bacterium C00003093]|nr:MAG: translation initiation factor SUI1 [Desulfuromonadales bacterium C00003093]